MFIPNGLIPVITIRRCNNHQIMNNQNRATKRILAAALIGMLYWLMIPSLLIGADEDSRADVRASAKQTVRDLELGIEVKPKSKTVLLTITNHSPEKRYLWVPLDLTPYRIILTDENGQLLKLTAKGAEKFEPGIGSVWVIELRKDVPQIKSIDLGPLFDFPQKGIIRCEVSRLVHFTDPQKPPSEKEWMKFSPVSIVIGDVASPDRVSPKNEGDAKPQR